MYSSQQTENWSDVDGRYTHFLLQNVCNKVTGWTKNSFLDQIFFKSSKKSLKPLTYFYSAKGTTLD